MRWDFSQDLEPLTILAMKSLLTIGCALVVVLASAAPLLACPLCQEASVAGSNAADPLQEARAYGYSIYLMVSMPYLLLGSIGFMIYRGYHTAQKKALAGRQLESTPETAPDA